MTLPIEINFNKDNIETILKWYGLVSKGKHMTKKDEETYHKFSLLLDTMIEDEEIDDSDD